MKKATVMFFAAAIVISLTSCDKSDEAWKAFDGLVENAEALKNIAVTPEYEILDGMIEGVDFKNNFEGLDFELKAMATDGNDGYFFVFEVTANGFDFQNHSNYYFVPCLQGDADDQYSMTHGFDENGKASVLVVSKYSPYLISTEELENALADLGEFIIEITELAGLDENGERFSLRRETLGLGCGITFRVKANFPPSSKFTFDPIGMKIMG